MDFFFIKKFRNHHSAVHLCHKKMTATEFLNQPSHFPFDSYSIAAVMEKYLAHRLELVWVDGEKMSSSYNSIHVFQIHF